MPPTASADAATAAAPVWKTEKIFQNLKFHQMSKKINKFNFPSVYSFSMGEKNSLIEIE